MAASGDVLVEDRLTRDTTPIPFHADGEEQTFRPRKWQALVWVTITVGDPRRRHLHDLASEHGAPTVVFPALVDTGCNESFLIHQWHLERWVRLPVQSFLAATKPPRLFGHRCPIIRADIWLHRNLGAAADHSQRAAKLQVSDGVTVSAIRTSQTFPMEAPLAPQPGTFGRLYNLFTGAQRTSETQTQVVHQWTEANLEHQRDSVPFDVYPRIPLIGMKTFATNHLRLQVCGKTGQFSIRRVP